MSGTTFKADFAKSAAMISKRTVEALSVRPFGLIAIVSPITRREVLAAVEVDADIILAWDGKELLMLKNRYGANLDRVTPVLRGMAEAAPTAGWGSVRDYCSDPAKPHTHLSRLRASGEWPVAPPDKIALREMRAVSQRNNRRAARRSARLPQRNTQSPKSRKVVRSYRGVAATQSQAGTHGKKGAAQ